MRARRGSTAVETAVAISALVFAFAGLMEIVHTAWVGDTMGRAARAAARAVALAPEGNAGTLDSVACAAIRRELALAEDFDCGANWTLTVDTGLTPEALLDGENGTEGDGDMVLVQIAWRREPWDLGGLPARPHPEGAEPPPAIAVGVARQEPAAES